MTRDSVPDPGNWSRVAGYGPTSYEGVSNPNYQIAIAKRMDASSNLLRERCLNLAPYTFFGTMKQGSVNWTSEMAIMPGWVRPDLTLLSVPDLVSYRDRALMHVKNKLNTKEGRVKSLVPLAEFRDMHTTYQSMADLTGKFLIGVVDAKRRLFKNPKRAFANLLDFTANSWLTYSFGIAPTMADFQGLAEAVTARLTRQQTIKEVGGSGFSQRHSRSAIFNVVGNTQVTQFAVFANCVGTYHLDVKVFFHSGRYIDLDNGVSNISSQFGLNILEVVPAAYELFPYSWLLDYFTTAGNVIQDTFESPSSNTIYNNETRVQTWNLESSFKPFVGSAVSGSVKGTNAIDSGILISRSKLANLPHAALRIKTLDEISVNAANRLRNLFSLAAPVAVRQLRK